MNTIKTLDRKSKAEWKQTYSKALSVHLINKNWKKLEELLPVAQELGVSKKQLQKSWFTLGNHQKSRDELVAAIISFASARRFDIYNIVFFDEIVECLERFINIFEFKFSREDLVHLDMALERIYSFQKTLPSKEDINIRRAKELKKRIRLAKDEAPSKIESPATYHVQIIYNALYPNMTQEEVRVEFARIVAPLVRKKMSESKNNNNKTDKKSHTDNKKKKK